jgi:hypothetical protein
LVKVITLRLAEAVLRRELVKKEPDIIISPPLPP